MKQQIKFLVILMGLAVLTPMQVSAQSDDVEYEYAEPTIENFARMYWRLGKFTPDQDVAVDNFMFINECSVFKDYYHNEFEWREIRNTSRKYLEQHKGNFPVRFEFIQPLSLGAYDFEKQGFHVVNDHKIKSVRRFEVYSDKTHSNICGEAREIAGYPRALLLELSRPLDFDFIPMEEKKAQALINRKIKRFKKLKEKHQNIENLYSFRDAVLVMKTKLFSIKPVDAKSDVGIRRSEVLAVLEGVEVYTDREREDLIFEETYRRKKVDSDFEKKLKEKFEASRRKKAEKIIGDDVINKIKADSAAADKTYP